MKGIGGAGVLLHGDGDRATLAPEPGNLLAVRSDDGGFDTVRFPRPTGSLTELRECGNGPLLIVESFVL